MVGPMQKQKHYSHVTASSKPRVTKRKQICREALTYESFKRMEFCNEKCAGTLNSAIYIQLLFLTFLLRFQGEARDDKWRGRGAEKVGWTALLIAEADMSLVICCFCLWWRSTHIFNSTQTHMFTHMHWTGLGSSHWGLALSIRRVTELFLQVCLQQLSPYGRGCNK